MQEIVSKRTECSKTFDLGGRKRGLDCHIGAIHYKDNYADAQEGWKDIDLTWEGNRITKAPYELILEGNKATVKDKKTGEVSTIELLEIGGIPIPPQAWEMSRGLAKALATDLEIVAGNGSVSFARILKSDKAPVEAKYRVTGNIPLRVKASDTEDELPVEWTIKDGILTETLKPDRPIKYPIRIDPTIIDPQVGASEDDGYEFEDSGAVDVTATTISIHSNSAANGRYWGGFRFVSAEFPAQGTTIDVAYLRVYIYSTSWDDANFNIHFEELAGPVSFTTDAFDITGRDRTEDSASWVADGVAAGGTGWYNSPSLCGEGSPAQELFDAYSPTAIVAICRPNQDSAKYFNVRSWDQSPNNLGAILHLEWTVGGEDYPISLSPGLTASVSIDRTLAWDRGMSPGLALAVTIVRGLAWDRATIPNLTISATVVKGWGRTITTTANLAVSATVTIIKGFVKSVVSALTASATVDRGITYTRDSAPDLAMSATVDRNVTYTRATQSALSVAISIIKSWGRTITTSPGLTISVTIAKSWGRTITTATAMAVSATISRVTAYKRATQTALSMAVTVVKGWGRAITTSTGLAISATVDRTVAYKRATQTALSVATSIVKAVAYSRTLQPALSVVVSVVKGWGRTITTSAGLTVSATISRVVAYNRAVSSGLTATVSLVRSWTKTIATSTGLIISVSVFIGRIIGRQLVIKVITSQYRNLNIVTAQYRIIKIITGQYRSLKIITAQNRLVKAITTYYRKVKSITGG